jgi:hypothetical protein
MISNSARGILLRLDGGRDRIEIPADLSLDIILDAPPPYIAVSFRFGVDPALLVYTELGLGDQRPANFQASIMHPTSADVRGLAVVIIMKDTYDGN